MGYRIMSLTDLTGATGAFYQIVVKPWWDSMDWNDRFMVGGIDVTGEGAMSHPHRWSVDAAHWALFDYIEDMERLSALTLDAKGLPADGMARQMNDLAKVYLEGVDTRMIAQYLLMLVQDHLVSGDRPQ